jgi:hypothetical protein
MQRCSDLREEFFMACFPLCVSIPASAPTNQDRWLEGFYDDAASRQWH